MPDQKQDAQKATDQKQDAKQDDQPQAPVYIVNGKTVDANGKPVKG